MSYEVRADNRPIFRTGSNQFTILNPKLKLEINKCGSLEFTISPTHPYYASMVKLKTPIDVYKDGVWVWSGRVYEDTLELDGNKKVLCEGALNYLLDTIQRPKEYHDISVRDYLNDLITNHNNQVEEQKRFKLGTVDVTDSNDSLYRFSNYETTLDCIKDKLLNRLGGCLVVAKVDGGFILHYLKSYPTINLQTIEYGKNIIDLSKVVEADEVYTVLVPLGKKDEQTEKRLTINVDGKDYIESTEAIELYGRIVRTETWDDVTLESNLLTKAQNLLNEGVKLKTTIKLNAIDLSNAHIDVDKLKLGNVKIKVPRFNIDESMLLSQMELNLTDPTSDRYTLGAVKRSLTEENDNLKDDIVGSVIEINKEEIKNEIATETEKIRQEIIIGDNKVKSEIEKEYLKISEKETILQETQSKIEQSENGIRTEVSEKIQKVEQDSKDFTSQQIESINEEHASNIQQVKDSINLEVSNLKNTISGTNATVEELSTKLSITAEEASFIKTTVNNLQSAMDGKVDTNTITEWARFDGANLELGVSNSAFKAKLSNTELGFYQGENKVAWINNNELHILKAIITNAIAVGEYRWVDEGAMGLTLY